MSIYSCQLGCQPNLVSKPDPWTAATGRAKNGHGVGLSQWGAQYAGSIGQTHTQILAFYYPNTVLDGSGGTGGHVGDTGWVVVNSAGLSVRISPNGSLLDYKLYNGHRIVVLDEASAGGYLWFRIRDELGRENGWVRSDFVSWSDPGGSGYNTWQEKYGNNTFVESYVYSGNVYRYQVDLNKWLRATGRSTIAEDGMYGTNTIASTRTFQAAMGLAVDGFAGPMTKSALFDLYGR